MPEKALNAQKVPRLSINDSREPMPQLVQSHTLRQASRTELPDMPFCDVPATRRWKQPIARPDPLHNLAPKRRGKGNKPRPIPLAVNDKGNAAEVIDKVPPSHPRNLAPSQPCLARQAQDHMTTPIRRRQRLPVHAIGSRTRGRWPRLNGGQCRSRVFVDQLNIHGP